METKTEERDVGVVSSTGADCRDVSSDLRTRTSGAVDMQMNYRDRYLDLLEKTLTFSLWPEPLRTVDTISKHDFRWHVARVIDLALSKCGARVGVPQVVDREVGRQWPAMAHTMAGRKRLRNIRDLATIVEAENIPGAFVECGVWRGGCSIYGAACLPDRDVYVCDSFCGLPYDVSDPVWCGYDFLRVSLEEVRKNFENYGLLSDRIHFFKGWFKDTLDTIPGPISILRADGDMYSSTMQILGHLYDKVSDGGFVIIDDWTIPQCREAVETFRWISRITSPIIDIDGVGSYWRKE